MVSFKVILIIFVLFIGTLIVQGQKFRTISRCGPHAHFKHCAKPISCQSSCHEPKGKICRAACTPGCVCNGHRVRNHHRQCVHPAECPQRRLKS